VFSDQAAFAVRFEWGERGLQTLAPGCDFLILVDVLSFSTCVDVATSRGAEVIPYPWNDERAASHARALGAELATKERSASGGFSLSPNSLAKITAGTRLVLPSLNGAALSWLAGSHAATATACLRNSRAVAEFARLHGPSVAVVACGERWPDGSLRVAWEDLVGAGAVISHLPGSRSPEAQAACEAFLQAAATLPERMRNCSSGRELIERGFAADLDWASALDVSQTVPLMQSGSYLAHRIQPRHEHHPA